MIQSFSPCVTFKEIVAIYHPYIKVVCRNTFYMAVYENVHASTPIDTLQLNNEDKKHFSALMVGIDSVSKQNLRRSMPKTYGYLEKYFVNLKGYLKVGDNTYPNLMAILTGLNITQVYKNCPFYVDTGNRKNNNFLSECDFIWNHFSNAGYITALAEDACPLGTFNYVKKGFYDPPTDYYYRPYFLAAEQLSSIKSKCHKRFCTGPENSGERVMNSAKDFSVTFRNQPRFGLFWMNAFSHDNINCPSAMDDKILQFLSDQSFVDSLDDTILLFFSDHGYRFGDIRNTVSGWLEERLPFIYLRIPDKFKRLYRREYNNLLTNSQRLTSTYDLHNTLQHVLQLRTSNNHSFFSPGCPKCQSLFTEISELRTCKDAGVIEHWCTCTSYTDISVTDPLVKDVASFVVQEVNKLVQSFPEGHKCNPYNLKSVHSAGISPVRVNVQDDVEVNFILIIVNMEPQAKFETTVEVPLDYPYRYKLLGDISRTDEYGSKSSCIRNSELKKYCSCDNFFIFLKNKVCKGLHIC